MAGKSSKDDDSDGSGNKKTKKNKLKIKAHDLEVKMESEQDMEGMVEMASAEMDNIMRASLRGELEVMEEEATFILGGH